jgi:hypothetical protein
MNPGREPLFCILYLNETENLSLISVDTTNAGGIMIIKNLPLVPFTWYAWNCYSTNPSGSKAGTVLLNPTRNDTLMIELDPTSKELVPSTIPAVTFNIYPNPFNPTTKVTFNHPVTNAKLTIINTQGQQVFSVNKFTGSHFVWDAKGSAAGIYLIRAEFSGKQIIRKAILIY